MLFRMVLAVALICGASGAGQQTKKSGAKTAIEPPLPESTEPPAKMVWVDHQTKKFYRRGHSHYGKGKHGEFMEQDAAVKAGYRDAGGRKRASRR